MSDQSDAAWLRAKARNEPSRSRRETLCAIADRIERRELELRRAGQWDEYHPAYIAGARHARHVMAGMDGPAHFDMSKVKGDGT